MKKHNKLVRFYRALLESLGCVIHSDGCINAVNLGQEIPVMVDNKKVYLPEERVLNQPSEGRAYFHPACESIASKETEMITALRKLITFSLYRNIRPVAEVLLKVVETRTTKTLPAAMVDKLKPLKGISATTSEEIVNIMKLITMDYDGEGQDTRIISFTIQVGGKTQDGQDIYRKAIPVFPFYKALVSAVNSAGGIDLDINKNVRVCGYECSYRAALCVMTIFEIAIPSIAAVDGITVAVTHQTAARMTALLRSYALIASEINVLISKFRKEFDDISKYDIDISWVEYLDDITDLANIIPALPYNNHNTTSDVNRVVMSSLSTQFSVSPDITPSTVHTTAGTTTTYVGDSIIGRHMPPEYAVPRDSAAWGKTMPPLGPNEVVDGVYKYPKNGLVEYHYISNNSVRVLTVDSRGLVTQTRTLPVESLINEMRQQYGHRLNTQSGSNTELTISELEELAELIRWYEGEFRERADRRFGTTMNFTVLADLRRIRSERSYYNDSRYRREDYRYERGPDYRRDNYRRDDYRYERNNEEYSYSRGSSGGHVDVDSNFNWNC